MTGLGVFMFIFVHELTVQARKNMGRLNILLVVIP